MTDAIDPRLAGWDFARRERELFATAKDLPTWRLANQSRRLLAAVLYELSNAIDAPDAELIDELDAGDARRLASLDLGALVVRATGSIIVLIGCGYERESMSLARSLVEGVIRGREVR